MEKRIIIAVVLSVVIIMVFQSLVVKPPAKVAQVAVAKTAESVPIDQKSATISTPKPSFTEKEFTVENDLYAVTFSNIGGAIKNIYLKKDKTELASIGDPREYIFAISGLPMGISQDLADYRIEQKDDLVTCSVRADGLDIIKQYKLHNSKHAIELQIFFTNASSSVKHIDYNIVTGAGVSENDAQNKRFIEAIAKTDGKIAGIKRPKEGRLVTPGIVSWTELKNKYFSLVVKPFVRSSAQFCKVNTDGGIIVGINTDKQMLEPGATLDNKFLLYAGPASPKTLRAVAVDLEETINYGFFGGISRVIISALNILYGLVHSWGIAIILLSVLLNLIVFPLTMKSFKSIQKMQELHPQMEKLKAQHKDSPQKLNKEMMELYKKYNINPLSGCLPMILQMPIFIALYNAIMKQFELRGASFLWIKDLSAPDAVKLPMSFPIIGNSINILPLIMVGAMVLQQKMSTKTMGAAVTDEQKQQQKMMLIMMPIIFGFVFYNMPSGLVLYWVVNTALTVIEQKVILKKSE